MSTILAIKVNTLSTISLTISLAAQDHHHLHLPQLMASKSESLFMATTASVNYSIHV